MNDTSAIVIVGGGHAGAALCGALVAAGLGSAIHFVCAEAELPYQRPPLSKAFLKSPQEALQPLRVESWYVDAGIRLHRGDAAVAIARAAKTITLRSGAVLPYAWLVLATGATARSLPGLAPTLANVAVLRSAADASSLRSRLEAAPSVTVLGGGFIGLEIAATARALGKAVTVLEAAPRLLQRSVSPELAEHVLNTHRANEIDIRLGVTLGEPEVVGDRLAALTVNGMREPVGLMVLGIGAAPEMRLAAAAGLALDNGIIVDATLRSSDPAILAIGDCANFPEYGSARRLRLESVQNANDLARTAAATISGHPEAYRAVPWFWTEQGPMRLQMVGLMPNGGTCHRRPGASPASFSLLHFEGERLICVESVNAAQDHLAARKIIESGLSPTPALACEPSRPLKSVLEAK